MTDPREAPGAPKPGGPENGSAQDLAAPAPALRLTLAVAAPRVTAADIERFLASRSAAGLAATDEVCLAASPAPGSDPREFDRWLDASASSSPIGSRASPASQSEESADAGPSSLRVTLHPSETTPMRLWGFAMAASRGRHVAVLDARDTLAPGWVTAWAEAMEAGGGPILCGPVDPGALADSCSWAAYLSEYGRFWTPLSPDDLAEAPGNNIVFPREALPPNDTLQRQGFWKTFHLAALREAGDSSQPLALAVSPGMVVRVERKYRLAAYLRRRYLHGRCYGGRRLHEPGAPPRWLCLGFTPLLPAVRTARVLARVANRMGSLLGQHNGHSEPSSAASSASRVWPAAALGPLVLGEIAWSWGEFAGYARGAGTACEELW